MLAVKLLSGWAEEWGAVGSPWLLEEVQSNKVQKQLSGWAKRRCGSPRVDLEEVQSNSFRLDSEERRAVLEVHKATFSLG